MTKKWVSRKRNLDFMLNNNPLGGIEGKKEVRCTTGDPIQRKLTRRLREETELTEFSDYPKRPKSKVTDIFSFNVCATNGTRKSREGNRSFGKREKKSLEK